MTGKRTKRIIAIFGGSGRKYPEVLKAAERLGQEIAGQKQILLTGGVRKDEENEKSAKGRAIKGAGSSPWVGVERKQSGAKLADQPEQHFCMISDLNHLRNYLEAHMCDAAIALAGDEGTKSEVTSALALGRPVAFVGDYWKSQGTTKYDLEEDPSHWLKYLYETTRDKFYESGGSKALVGAVQKGLAHPGHYVYFDSRATASDVVGWILSELPEGEPFRGRFNEIVGHKGHKLTIKGYKDAVEEEVAAREYERWLTKFG